MKPRKAVRLDVRTRYTAWIVEGSDRRLLALLARLDVARQYDGDERCWMVPARRVADVAAALEHEGRDVLVEYGLEAA